jgi:hypothetical protein
VGEPRQRHLVSCSLLCSWVDRSETLDSVFWWLVLSAWNRKSTIQLPFYFMRVLLEFSR